jgi:tRNA dimethylallyltransferase
MGPTASGKTSLAVEMYERFPIDLISVDSALVYKGMDIGTAKPDPGTLAKAPHHLIDIIDPTQTYSAAQFRQDAVRLMAESTREGKIPVLVGGTMLYYKSLQDGLSGLPEADPEVRDAIDAEALAAGGWPAMHRKLAEVDSETALRLKPTDSQRIQRALEVYRITGMAMSELFKRQSGEVLPYRVLKIALQPSDRSVLHQRIAERFDAMVHHGFMEEVKALLEEYPSLEPDMPSMRCVGYRQALEYLRGEVSREEFREKGIAATRQLAKRQLTWLRSMPDTAVFDCLDKQLSESIFKYIKQEIKLFS